MDIAIESSTINPVTDVCPTPVSAITSATRSNDCKTPGCPNPIPRRKGTGPQPEFCSKACRQALNARLARKRKGKLTTEDWLAVDQTCQNDECGIVFRAEKGQSYCSSRCRKDVALQTRKKVGRPKQGIFGTRGKVLEGLASLMELDLAGRRDGMQDVLNKFCSIRWSKKEEITSDRRSPETKAIIAEAQNYLAQEGEMTLRHLFYHLVSVGLVQNNRNKYIALTGIIGEARLRGDVSHDALLDNSRDSVTHAAYDDPREFLRRQAGHYRIDMWENQDALVEIWTEKDSVVSVLQAPIYEYRVPLRVLRGQASLTYMNAVAKSWELGTKPVHVYYLGDHDPAGYMIENSARDRLFLLLIEEYGWSIRDIADRVTWKRIAFVHADFENHDIEALPEDDKKKGLEGFMTMFPDGKKAELEALPPSELRTRVTDAINSHRDYDQWDEDDAREDDTIEDLKKLAGD